jgi:hypothetical protein
VKINSATLVAVMTRPTELPMSNIVRLRNAIDADAYRFRASPSDLASRAAAFTVIAFMAGLIAVFVAVAARQTSVDSSSDAIAISMYGP